MAPAAGRDAKLLYDLERFLALESLDYPAECTGQPADILVKRKVLWASL